MSLFPFKGCDDNTPHCWHQTGEAYTTAPLRWLEVCCNCNETRDRREHPKADRDGHGPHRPKQQAEAPQAINVATTQTTQELIEELERRSTGIMLAVILKTQGDGPNAEEGCQTKIQGGAADLAWLATLLTAHAHRAVLLAQEPMPGDGDHFDACSGEPSA